MPGPDERNVETKELDDWLEGAFAELEESVQGLREESKQQAESLRSRLLGLPAKLLTRKPRPPRTPGWYDEQVWTIAEQEQPLLRLQETRAPLWQRLFMSEGASWFFPALALYLFVGALLVYRHDVIQGDSLSRLANGYYVITSRFPHAGAIGFVWNPLPSLVTLPFVPLRHLAPSLFTRGYLMNIESAVFMAGTVVLVARFLRQTGVSTVWRIVMTASFALTPMIVLYGANGMSEAMMLFFLLAACVSATRWVHTGSSRALVAAGLSLALAYLTRDEGLVAAVAVMMVVAFIGFDRAAGAWRARLRKAAVDVAIVGVPFVLTFGVLAGITYELVHSAFPAFSSQYGNSTQVADQFGGIAAVLRGGTGALARLQYSLTQSVVLEPLLLVVLLLGLWRLIRKDFRILMPVATLGPILAFHWAEFARAQTFGWLRFSIVEIPLVVLLAGLLIGDKSRDPKRQVVEPAQRSWLAPAALGIVAVAVVAVSFPAQIIGMQNARLGREEAGQLHGLSSSLAPHGYAETGAFAIQRSEASWLDAQHLPNGSVLLDTAYSFAVVLASDHPRQFVIDSDYDFDAAIADPVTFRVRYVIVPDPRHYPHDRINQVQGQLFDSGGPGMKLAKEFVDPRLGTFRVYAVSQG